MRFGVGRTSFERHFRSFKRFVFRLLIVTYNGVSFYIARVCFVGMLCYTSSLARVILTVGSRPLGQSQSR